MFSAGGRLVGGVARTAVAPCTRALRTAAVFAAPPQPRGAGFARCQAAPWNSPSFQQPQRRSAFSCITPKTLAEITKLPLLEHSDPVRIKEVWQEFHAKKQSCVSATISPGEYGNLVSMGGESRMFVFPIPQVLEHCWP